MGTEVARWVRLGVAVILAGPQLVIGLWAALAPQSFFDSFPGFDPRLVAAEPPYNQHLVTDVGAGFLATGLVLLVAAVWAKRTAVLMALLAFVAFTVPHVAYHVTHPADAMSTFENALNAGSLATGLVWSAVFAWALRARPADVGSSRAALDHREVLEPVV